MIFGTTCCSEGLYSALYVRGIDACEVKSFSLDILDGPVAKYLSTLPIEFTKNFHIGCSFDKRSPSFDYRAERKEGNGKLWIVYDRSLSGDNIFPQDKRGERDLEKLAAMFSDNNLYEESITIGREIINDGLCYNPRMELHFLKSKLCKLSSSYNYKEITNHDYWGVFKKLRYPLWHRLAKKYSGESLKEDIDEIKKSGVSAKEITAEFLKIFESKAGKVSELNEV
jgi:hypothetical protein